VVHVVISLEPGGLERLVVRWTRRRNETQPGSTAVCCLDKAGALAADLPSGTVTSLAAARNRFPWDRVAVRRLRAFAVERGAAILHSHNLAAQQYAVLAAWRTGMRVVHTEHGSRPHASGLVAAIRERLLNRCTDRLVAVSSSVARVMPRDTAVIPNGVSRHEPASAEELVRLRVELGLPPGWPVIGCVGRLTTVKGVDRLLWALGAMVRECATPCVLLVVGDGPEREMLEGQARRLGVSEKVVFAGFRPDARRLYDLMDCVVLPSRSEGLPVVLLEGMSAGVPVLATDVGANKEVLLNGEAGTMLPADCMQWPAILRSAIEHGERQRAAVEKARESVTRQYSEDATVEAYEREYGTLCAQGLVTFTGQ
jgi:glycosyltransferase involved in cell wall biosynthesis